MSQVHVVRQGEQLSSIASLYGFRSWKALYDHPANAELKRRRPNPNVLMPGDLVAIPEPLPIEANRPTGSWHDFTVEREEPRLKVRLVDVDGTALANQAYQLFIDGEERPGTTDGDGMVDESIYSWSRTALLKTTVTRGDEPHDLEWTLAIGSLDPHLEISGIQARLSNLHFYEGTIDGNFGPKTREALMSFQSYAGLDPTGVPDAATLKELQRQHDGED
jgi:N-acetylmuramoyl-L-alanine amidase